MCCKTFSCVNVGLAAYVENASVWVDHHRVVATDLSECVTSLIGLAVPLREYGCRLPIEGHLCSDMPRLEVPVKELRAADSKAPVGCGVIDDVDDEIFWPQADRCL